MADRPVNHADSGSDALSSSRKGELSCEEAATDAALAAKSPAAPTAADVFGEDTFEDDSPSSPTTRISLDIQRNFVPTPMGGAGGAGPIEEISTNLYKGQDGHFSLEGWLQINGVSKETGDDPDIPAYQLRNIDMGTRDGRTLMQQLFSDIAHTEPDPMRAKLMASEILCKTIIRTNIDTHLSDMPELSIAMPDGSGGKKIVSYRFTQAKYYGREGCQDTEKLPLYLLEAEGEPTGDSIVAIPGTKKEEGMHNRAASAAAAVDPEGTGRNILNDGKNALTPDMQAWIHGLTDPSSDGKKVEVMGFSMGGTVASMIAELEPDRVRVAYSWNGPPRGELNSPTSPWASRDEKPRIYRFETRGCPVKDKGKIKAGATFKIANRFKEKGNSAVHQEFVFFRPDLHFFEPTGAEKVEVKKNLESYLDGHYNDLIAVSDNFNKATKGKEATTWRSMMDSLTDAVRPQLYSISTKLLPGEPVKDNHPKTTDVVLK